MMNYVSSNSYVDVNFILRLYVFGRPFFYYGNYQNKHFLAFIFGSCMKVSARTTIFVASTIVDILNPCTIFIC